MEAGHVEWWSHGGPDRVENGLALCTIHHKALDSGIVGLDEDRRMVVSPRVTGTEAFDRLIGQLEGRLVRAPKEGEPPVGPPYIEWHRENVFKEA